MKIAMLSTFGPEVRGVSYYSDCLRTALSAEDGVDLVTVDYARLYPGWLYPAESGTAVAAENRVVHYARPWTWSLASYSPDIIHLQSWSFATSLMHRRILREARRRNIPAVMTLHNPASHEHVWPLGSLERACLSLVDRIIIHDACGLDSIPDRWHEKVQVIPHGVEELPLDLPQSITDSADSPYVLYFGNIRPYKGVELLATAWQQVAQAVPEARLCIAGRLWQGRSLLGRLTARLLGTAAYSQQIRTLADSSDLQRVEFRLGFIEEEELDWLIRGARYCVFPYTRFSGHSGAVARSAAHGVPVLVSDVGGLAALAIDNDYVFRANDRDSLAGVLKARLLDETDLVEERHRQLEKARALSWSRSARDHVALYRTLTSR